jgi:transposase
MPPPYSRDLCEKVMIKHFRDGDSKSTIAAHLVIHRPTVRRSIQRWEAGEDICLSRERGWYSGRAFDTRTFAVLLHTGPR